jgi:hypothetical protein
MKKTVIISTDGLGISLLFGKEVIKLNETLSIENAEKLAVQFPHYITIKEEDNAKPASTRPVKVSENAVASESQQ